MLRSLLGRLALFAVAVPLVLSACSETPVGVDMAGPQVEPAFSWFSNEEGEIKAPLMAGQHIEVGVVTVSDDGTSLTVEYDLSPASILDGWVITKAHMYADVKTPKNGAPGRFPFHSETFQGTSYSFTVALAELGVASGDELNVAAHAEVERLDVIGETDEVIGYFLQETGDYFEYQDFRLSCPTLEEIAGALPESFTINLNGDGNGYYDVTISDAGELNGTYDWYCIDQTHNIGLGDYTVRVFSSYEDLPDAIVNNGTGDNNLDHPENMDLVNWVINNYGTGTSGNLKQVQVQDVIWALVDDAKTRENLDAAEKVAYDLAVANGEGFVPGDGQSLAIVLQPVDSSLNTVGQVTIGQVTIGQVSFAALGLQCIEVALYEAVYAPLLGEFLQGETAWGIAAERTLFRGGWGSYFTYLVK